MAVSSSGHHVRTRRNGGSKRAGAGKLTCHPGPGVRSRPGTGRIADLGQSRELIDASPRWLASFPPNRRSTASRAPPTGSASRVSPAQAAEGAATATPVAPPPTRRARRVHTTMSVRHRHGRAWANRTRRPVPAAEGRSHVGGGWYPGGGHRRSPGRRRSPPGVSWTPVAAAASTEALGTARQHVDAEVGCRHRGITDRSPVVARYLPGGGPVTLTHVARRRCRGLAPGRVSRRRRPVPRQEPVHETGGGPRCPSAQAEAVPTVLS